MMRRFCVIVVTVFLVVGCSDRCARTTHQTESAEVEGQDVSYAETTDSAADVEARESAAHDEVDAALRDLVYPGSKLEGQFTAGNMVSFQFVSPDGFVNVVDYYRGKFPDTNVGSGTSVYFGKQNLDGSNVTVTLTKLDDGTQVILRQEK